ncbi:MAG: phosphate signaling complex protein PhoU [Hyphomicrobiales bacterium]|nr:MAG: phosphate signaling complex protein PhoU [Hyphomicrobiales bacterium]
MTAHTVTSFDEDLKELNAIVLDMGVRAARSVEFAAFALQNRDVRVAQQIISADKAIDDLQHDLEQKAIVTIARRQPVADDLRQIIAALRIANDLERIGDLAKNLAKRSLAILQEGTPVVGLAGLAKLSDRVRVQLDEVLAALKAHDDKAALAVWRSDHEIDALHTSLFRELLTYMMEDPRNIGSCAHLLFCAKNLERIGDHATNIAETVHYVVTGEVLALDRPRADQSSAFATDMRLPAWKG